MLPRRQAVRFGVPCPVSSASWYPYFLAHGEARCLEKSHVTVIIFARPSADFNIIPTSWAYSMLLTSFRTHANGSEFAPHPVLLKVRLEANQLPHNIWILTEPYQYDVYRSSEGDIEKSDDSAHLCHSL